MRPYPRVQEYREALQNPRSCFASDVLKRAVPKKDDRGHPLPSVGGMAAVFQLDLGGTSCALKVFKNDVPQRERRYRAISDFLGTFRSPYLVGFAYETNGVRVPRDGGGFKDAEWFPYLRMDWVAGAPLNEWLAGRVRARAARDVVGFAERFEAMVRDLKSRAVAHGDLQQGNVLVVGDEPVLVDYDGMFVPALTEPADEFGLDGFQHPRRKEEAWWSADLDDFSAWVIWLTLRALAADLDLWDKHKVGESDSMLFELRDLTRPDASKVWPDLLRSRDKDVRDRAEALFESLRPPHAVPPFVLDRTRPLRDLCDAPARDWDAIAAKADESSRAGVELPPELRAVADKARRLVADRDLLAQAVASRDPRGVAVPADLERDWPACAPLVASARERVAQARALDELDAANDPRAFAALWRKHAGLLADVAGAERYEFLAAVAEPPSEQAVVAAWERLHAAGGHPSVPDPHPRVQLARQRLPLLAAVDAVPRRAYEVADRDFVRAFRPELLADCAEAAELQRWYDQARPRVVALDLIEEVVAAGRAFGADRFFEQLRDAAAALPANYAHSRKKEVDQAREWLAARDDLARACAAGQWEEVDALAKSHVFARDLPSAHVASVQKAIERVEARRQLEGAMASGSLERVAGCRADLLADWADCRGLFARAARARQLLPALRQLQQEAADPRDGRALASLWLEHGPDLVNWREAAPLRQAAASWEARLLARDEFERLLKSDRPAASAVVEGWEKLRDVGGHPDAAAWAGEAAKARTRVERMDELRRVPAEPSESADRLFAAAWHPDLDGWWEAEPWRHRLSIVRDRLAVLAALEGPLRDGDDLAIVDASARLPGTYRFSLPADQARVAQARQRADALLLVRKAHAERRWQDVVALAASLQGAAWPADLRRQVDEAAARVAARQELKTAVDAASLERAAAAYRRELLDDWPECAGLVARGRTAVRLLPTLLAVRALAAAPGDGRRLVETWRAQGASLAGWAEAEPLRREAASWKARLDALETYLGLTDAEQVSARALANAWQRVLTAGVHPEGEGLRPAAELNRRRAELLDALRAVPDEVSQGADEAFFACWDEAALGGWWEGEDLRPRLDAVAGRRAALAALEEALAAEDDERAAALADALPGGYDLSPDLSEAVHASRGRVRLALRLREVLDDDPSDLAIAQAYDEFVAAGLTPSAADAGRCELARRRRRALLAMRKVSPDAPPDAQDEAIKRLWREGDLGPCEDATDEERQRYALAESRSALSWKLLDAVAVRDLFVVVELADDPLLADYPPVEAARPVIDGMVAEATKLNALRAALSGELGDDEFARLDLDLSCVAEHLPSFESQREALARVLRREADRAALRNGKLELAGEPDSPKVVVRWGGCTWRTFGLGDWACKVAVTTEEPAADGAGVRASVVTASAYRSGVRRDVPRGARRVYVTVWPLLRLEALGLEATGRPLRLAIDVPEPKPGPWWRGFVARIVPGS